jgi:hypothetical protein
MGIVEAALAGDVTIETDWRNALPANWTVDVPLTVDSLVHTPTGTYLDGTTDTAYLVYGFSPGSLQAGTFMIQLAVSEWTAFYASISGQASDYFECAAYGDNTNEGSSLTAASQGTSADFVSLGSASMVILALTMSASGTANAYLIKNDATTDVNTDASLTPGTLSDLTTVTMTFSAFNGVELGTPGTVQVVRTLVAPNQEYNQTEIEAVATSWGWTPLDVDQYESNWTTTALPSGWSVDPESTGTPVYAAGGTYNNATDATESLWFRRSFTTRGYNKLTMMFAVDVAVGADDHTFDLEIGDALLTFYIETTTPDKLFDTYITGQGNTHTSTGTGMVILAATLDSDGTFRSYKLDNGLPTETFTDNVGPIPSPNETVSEISLSLRPWDRNLETMGTPGDLKVLRTYIGLDEVLNQTQIETKAGTWGWS